MMIDSDHTCPFRTHILLGHANFPQEFEDFVGPPLLAQPKPTSAVPLIRWIRRKQSTGKAETIITNTPQFANGTGTSATATSSSSVNNNPTIDKVRRLFRIFKRKKNPKSFTALFVGIIIWASNEKFLIMRHCGSQCDVAFKSTTKTFFFFLKIFYTLHLLYKSTTADNKNCSDLFLRRGLILNICMVYGLSY